MKLMVLGAPGAGKGTQAEIISDRYSIPIIGTGNLIREAIKSGSELGKQISGYVDAGELVPDGVVIELLKERMSQPDAKDGYILDGFPRNVKQAEALDEMGIEIEKVVYIHVEDTAIIGRLSGRRFCGECGSSYHIEYNPPKAENVCDKDGAALIIRSDDNPETVKSRLNVYHEQTAPLVDYYEKGGKLRKIEGQGSVAEITKLFLSALEA